MLKEVCYTSYVRMKKKGHFTVGKRGMTVGTVLLVIAIVATLGVALSSVSVQHLGLMNRQSNSERARNLAESAIHRAIEQVLVSEDFQYGVDGQESEIIRVELNGTLPGSQGLLSFNEETAAEFGFPDAYSTNNITDNGPVEGADETVVPKESLRLVGVGRCGQVEKKLEAILHVPAFPYALASSGSIRCQGGVKVASLDSQVEIDQYGRLRIPENLHPAHILSNEPDARPGVSLGADTLVTGDVEAAGSLDLATAAVVQGRLRPDVSPVSFPEFDLARYNPGSHATQIEPNSGSAYISSNGEEFRGQVRVNGDFQIHAGGLRLDGALLYVDGDLEIRQGGVSGRGVLVVDGDVRISGSARLQAESEMAILNSGNMNLRGNGPNSSFIQGLFYSRGVVRAEQLTVVGAMIVGDDGSDSLTLEETYLYTSPSLRKVTVEVGSTEAGTDQDTFTIYGDSSGNLPDTFDSAVQPSPSYRVPALQSTATIEDESLVVTTVFLTTKHPERHPGPESLVMRIPLAFFEDDRPDRFRRHLRGLPEIRQFSRIVTERFAGEREHIKPANSSRAEAFLNGVFSVAKGSDEGTSPGGDGTQARLITIEPSEFIDKADRLQVVLWREI